MRLSLTAFQRHPWDQYKKEGLSGIPQFFSLRLNQQDDRGISVQRLADGSLSFISHETSEMTMAGEVPAQLWIRPEGVSLVSYNPGLLRRLHTGTLMDAQRISGGSESIIHRIPLKTSNGQEEFVMKYTFPYVSLAPDYVLHNSGILTAYLMDLATNHQPVEGLRYANPLIATHDMTLAHVAPDGFMLSNFNDMWKIGINFLDDAPYWFIPEASKNLMRRMFHSKNKSTLGIFHGALLTSMIQMNTSLHGWVEREIAQDSVLQLFRFTTRDLEVNLQTVVDIPAMYQLWEEFNAQDGQIQEITRRFAETLTLVEFGSGVIWY